MRILLPFLLFVGGLSPAASYAQQVMPENGKRASNSPPKYWGIKADCGPVSFEVNNLNKFFSAKTAAILPQEGSSVVLHALASNPVFGYGSLYYERAVANQSANGSFSTLSLDNHTFGFQLHKVLLDKRVKVVLPSLGIGYRLMNLTYNRNTTATVSPDSLLQQPGSFTLRAQNLVVKVGGAVYYTIRQISWLSQGEIDLGLTGSYAYSVRQGDWFLIGTNTPVAVPRDKLDYYTINLSVCFLVNR
ncbi:MAG TPA: hypothetical protein VF598_02035 [Hymenobacter sp.]|jgi:hypothetical protein